VTKLPQQAPPWDVTTELLEKHRDLMRAEVNAQYLHWDELRHRPLPAEITHRQWWTLIKLSRILRRVPITSVDGVEFSFGMPDTVQRLVHEVDRDASGRIELPEDISKPGLRDRYVASSLIEEAIRSSQLEGASTTRAVAKEMLRTQREPRDVSERMIVNNFRAMEWIRAHVQEPLTRAKIFELHAIMTADTLDVEDGGGRFRRDDELIRVHDLSTGEVVHVPPPAESLPARMTALCKLANGSSRDDEFIHPVVRAILVHFAVAYDHPFVDGNGRTARALFYWSMLRQGYWLTEFISISRAIQKARTQYDRAYLYTETDGNDTTYFVLNQLKMLRSAIDELTRYLERKTREVREVESQIRNRDDLNHRQIILLGHVLRNPDARLTIEGHQTSHRVVYQTARTDLLGLVKRGFLAQTKQGKQLVFTAVADLERRMKAK
jgi:Fic family protein